MFISNRPRTPLQKTISRMAFLAGIATTLVGCAHAPPTPIPNTADSEWMNTTITITYAMHHARRELWMDAHADQIQGLSLMDGSPLRQSTINAEHYKDFLSQVQDFIQKRRNLASQAPAENSAECRSPFKITLKNQKESTEVQGCRTGDDGTFGHILKEGEFLIYRQK